MWSWVSSPTCTVTFKGYARCLPCAGLACTECCLLLLECVLVVPHWVTRAMDGYRMISELVSFGEGWMWMEFPLGKACLRFWARWRFSGRIGQIQSCLPFNESQVYELCQPNTCRLWKAWRKRHGPVWSNAFCRGKLARHFFLQKEGGKLSVGSSWRVTQFSLDTGLGLCPSLSCDWGLGTLVCLLNRAGLSASVFLSSKWGKHPPSPLVRRLPGVKLYIVLL